MVTTALSMPGGWEWLIIGLFVLLIFGAKRIPELARGLGKGINEFKKGIHDVHSEIKKDDYDKSSEVSDNKNTDDDKSSKDKAS